MSFILKRFLLIAGSVSVFGFIISFIPFFHFGSIVSAVTGEPTFLVQPQSVTVSAGQMATLNAVVAGDTPMSYQWYQVNTGYSVIGSTPIPGATGSTYSTPPMYATAQYWLRAQNNLGTVVSQTVTVTVTPTQTSPPVITQHPLGVLIDSGQTATLSVVASGTDPLTYQWYQTGTSGTALIPGATAKIWTTPALTSTTRYFVRVTNTYGTTDSLVATVQVSASIALAPAISQQPQSQTIAAGQTATLSVSATGAQPLGYQWYQVTRGYAVVGSVAIPGATASTYMTAALNATTQYWVQVSNSEGIATSATATVTVTATPTSPPVITEQPHGARIENGQTATLMVTASGTGTLAYQWYEVKNGVNTMIAGAGNNTYNTPPLTVTATYFVRVTNAYGATDSLSATVEVQPVISQAPLITQQPVNQTIATGQTATLSVVAGGGQPLSYQWYQAASNSNLLIPNATGTSYTTPALTATASYFVRVSNSYGMVDSTTVTVTVTQPSMANNAQFLAQSVPAQMAAGQPYSVAVQMKNTGTSTWTTTGSNRFFLSSQNPQDTTTWGYAWQALPGNVAPGEWAIVTFIVTAPAQAGTYNFQWRMVQEAVGWFGETTPNVTVTVGSAAPLAPVIGKQPEVQTVAAGQTAKLGVVASGSGTLSYQWYQVTPTGNIAVNGATASTLVTQPVTGSTAYFVKITNLAGSLTSLIANVLIQGTGGFSLTQMNPPRIGSGVNLPDVKLIGSGFGTDVSQIRLTIFDPSGFVSDYLSAQATGVTSDGSTITAAYSFRNDAAIKPVGIYWVQVSVSGQGEARLAFEVLPKTLEIIGLPGYVRQGEAIKVTIKSDVDYPVPAKLVIRKLQPLAKSSAKFDDGTVLIDFTFSAQGTPKGTIVLTINGITASDRSEDLFLDVKDASFPTYPLIDSKPFTVVKFLVNQVWFYNGQQLLNWPNSEVVDQTKANWDRTKPLDNIRTAKAAYQAGESPSVAALIQTKPAGVPNLNGLKAIYKVYKSGSDEPLGSADEVTLTDSQTNIPAFTLEAAKLEAVKGVVYRQYALVWKVSYDKGQTWKDAGSPTDAKTGPHTIYWTVPCTKEPNKPPCFSPQAEPPFVNPLVNGSFSGLYDRALEWACDFASKDKDGKEAPTTDKATIAERITNGVGAKLDFRYNNFLSKQTHPLTRTDTDLAFGGSSDHSALLNGLLRSIGIEASIKYYWSGITTKWNPFVYYVYVNDSDQNDGVKFVSFQQTRPQNGSIEANPHFDFFAVVQVNDVAGFYDPSYGDIPNNGKYAEFVFSESINDNGTFNTTKDNHRIESVKGPEGSNSPPPDPDKRLSYCTHGQTAQLTQTDPVQSFPVNSSFQLEITIENTGKSNLPKGQIILKPYSYYPWTWGHAEGFAIEEDILPGKSYTRKYTLQGPPTAGAFLSQWILFDSRHGDYFAGFTPKLYLNFYAR